MAGSAPRLPWPLVEEVRRLARTEARVAQICRDAGRFAAEHGFQQPSYQTVRRLVLRERSLLELPGPVEPLLAGWLRARSPVDAVDEALRRVQDRAAARAAIEAERAWRPGGVTRAPGEPKRLVGVVDELVIVVDQSSSDGTRAVAEASGAVVLERAWTGFADQRNFGLAHVRAKWRLVIDADEKLEGGEAIRAAVLREDLPEGTNGIAVRVSSVAGSGAGAAAGTPVTDSMQSAASPRGR